MSVRRRTKALANKIAYMSQANKNKIADVCREENIIRGILFEMLWERRAGRVCRRETEFLAGAVAEFGVHCRKDLFGGRRCRWKPKTIAIDLAVVLMQDSILRRTGD